MCTLLKKRCICEGISEDYTVRRDVPSPLRSDTCTATMCFCGIAKYNEHVQLCFGIRTRLPSNEATLLCTIPTPSASQQLRQARNHPVPASSRQDTTIVYRCIRWVLRCGVGVLARYMCRSTGVLYYLWRVESKVDQDRRHCLSA